MAISTNSGICQLLPNDIFTADFFLFLLLLCFFICLLNIYSTVLFSKSLIHPFEIFHATVYFGENSHTAKIQKYPFAPVCSSCTGKNTVPLLPSHILANHLAKSCFTTPTQNTDLWQKGIASLAVRNLEVLQKLQDFVKIATCYTLRAHNSPIGKNKYPWVYLQSGLVLLWHLSAAQKATRRFHIPH